MRSQTWCSSTTPPRAKRRYGNWLPAQATYTVAEFSTAAVKGLGTGTAQAGTSIQRLNDIDTNAAMDWTTGASVASTWDALNAGQAVIP